MWQNEKLAPVLLPSQQPVLTTALELIQSIEAKIQHGKRDLQSMLHQLEARSIHNFSLDMLRLKFYTTFIIIFIIG